MAIFRRVSLGGTWEFRDHPCCKLGTVTVLVTKSNTRLSHVHSSIESQYCLYNDTKKNIILLFLFTRVLEMGISCSVMLILCRNNIGELQLYFYFTLLSFFSTTSFWVFVIPTVLFLFLGASIVSVFKNLRTKGTEDLVFMVP